MTATLSLIGIALFALVMGWPACGRYLDHIEARRAERRAEITAYVRPAIDAEVLAREIN